MAETRDNGYVNDKLLEKKIYTLSGSIQALLSMLKLHYNFVTGGCGVAVDGRLPAADPRGP